MAILIGTDEAGYGPNLGPLVVAATCWRVPNELVQHDLYELLCASVTSKTSPQSSERGKLAVADSKLLYQPRGSLEGLEHGVFAALAWLGQQPDTWRELWSALAKDAEATMANLPWYVDYDCPVPIDAAGKPRKQRAQKLHQDCRSANVELIGQQAVVVFPSDFNDAVDRLGSKGALLTQTTLELACSLVPDPLTEPVYVGCDKHGGRSKYAAAIQAAFDDVWVEVLKESRPESHYKLTHQGHSIELTFKVGGESFLPSALASMTAKYLRELAMKAFNEFWKNHLPDLRPTAGYPQDAKRFRAEIEPLPSTLGIEERTLWRSR